MPIELFGFSLGKRGKESPKPQSAETKENLSVKSFVQPDDYDGSFALDAGAGVVNGTNEYVEITGAAGDLSGSTHADNDVIVLTHATGFNGAAEVLTAKEIIRR